MTEPLTREQIERGIAAARAACRRLDGQFFDPTEQIPEIVGEAIAAIFGVMPAEKP